MSNETKSVSYYQPSPVTTHYQIRHEKREFNSSGCDGDDYAKMWNLKDFTLHTDSSEFHISFTTKVN